MSIPVATAFRLQIQAVAPPFIGGGFWLDKGKRKGYSIFRVTIGGYGIDQERKDVLLRLRRIGGQIRGLQRMVEEEVACADILNQVAAVTAAVKKVGTVVLKAYMGECLDKTQRAPSARRMETLRNFQKAISRYIDWA